MSGLKEAGTCGGGVCELGRGRTDPSVLRMDCM